MTTNATPVVQGKIERRILLNYRIDAEIAAARLPSPYRPKLHRAWAIGGICLIRISNIRPRFAPPIFGLSSENAACRYAVEWDEDENIREGMYIPHRDTSSRLSTLLGNTLLPGPYAYARFDIRESFDELYVALHGSSKSPPSLLVEGHISTRMPKDSIFRNIDEAATFFQYHNRQNSDGTAPDEFAGIKLRNRSWEVIPLEVTEMQSLYFDDKERFPEGSIFFDSALLMRGTSTDWVRETWRSGVAEAAIPIT